jgi:hypothetical protein
LQKTATLTGSAFSDSITYGPGPGQGRLLIWKLSTSPLTGIQNLENQNGILVYPNPFNSSSTIQLNKPVNNAELNIYNMYGQKIKTTNNISGDKIKIDRDNLPGGIYFIRLTQDNKVIATDKLIIID